MMRVNKIIETPQLETHDWILANSVDPKNGVMGKRDTEIVQFSVKGKKLFPRMSKSDFSKLLVNNIIEEFE